MRKTWLLLSLLFICIYMSSCKVQEGNVEHTDNHIKYFGFVLTDCGFDAPNDRVTKTNYLDEVDDFVNIADINIDSLKDIGERVALIREGDNSVILHIGSIFTETIIDESSPTGVKYILMHDYKEKWEIWKQNQSFEISSDIFFYLPDEPAWNNMNMSELDIIATTIKKDFPMARVMVAEASPAIKALDVSDKIDIVGFDQYGTVDPENDKEFLANLEMIKTKLNEKQKIVMIIESQWMPEYEKYGYTQDVLIDITKSYYNLAIKENKVEMVIAYLLPGGFDTEGQLGFRDLNEDVRNAYVELGERVLE